MKSHGRVAVIGGGVVGCSRLMETDEEGTLARPKILRQERIDPKTAEYRYPARIT